VVTNEKHYPEFEHIEEYEKMLIKMKIIKRTTQILFLFSIVGFQIQAQEVLTIEDAIKIALENNYDIKLPKRPEG
jgi:hypothetical protein